LGKILVVGNWKMHMNASQASLLLHRLQERIPIYKDVAVVLSPSMLTLQPLSVQIDRRKFRLAAQNAYFVDEGAFTGEVSFTMLRELVHYVIIGHSERRRFFHEDLDTIKKKVAACVRNDITPILCVGETKQERDDGETKQVLHDQLLSGLAELTPAEVGNIVVAYEPVWAISDGTNFADHFIAKPQQVAEAVDYIRRYIRDVFNDKSAREVRILYGGSAVPDIVQGFLDVPGVDGFLVGGASLNYHTFSSIIQGCHRWQRGGKEENNA
jgi:triosephosphate isomerase (TIM)